MAWSSVFCASKIIKKLAATAECQHQTWARTKVILGSESTKVEFYLQTNKKHGFYAEYIVEIWRWYWLHLSKMIRFRAPKWGAITKVDTEGVFPW